MERFSHDDAANDGGEGRSDAPPSAGAPDAAVVDRPDRVLLELVTDHLRLREAVRDDLPALLPVYESHRTDRANDPAEREERLRRLVHEWRVLETLRTHHTLAIYRRTAGETLGAPVGVLDYMDESPHTHQPWLGLILVDAACTGQGIAREALQALFAYGASLGWTRIGTGVPEEDAASRAFLAHFGFVESGRVPGPVPGEAAGALAVLERSLTPEAPIGHG